MSVLYQHNIGFWRNMVATAEVHTGNDARYECHVRIADILTDVSCGHRHKSVEAAERCAAGLLVRWSSMMTTLEDVRYLHEVSCWEVRWRDDLERQCISRFRAPFIPDAKR